MAVDTMICDLRPTRVERWGAIVIGAGRGGIAMGRLLLEREVDLVILDRRGAGGPERNAMRFDLPVRMSTEVTQLRWNGTHYILQSRALSYEARHVVVATGACAHDWSWIHPALPMENGVPCTVRGMVPTLPGLYFIGQPFQREFGVSCSGIRNPRYVFIAECIASEHE